MCLCCNIRFYRGSIPRSVGKHPFYILIFVLRNFAPKNGENPDSVGVFLGYIFFVASLWWARRDLNPHVRSEH